MERKIELELRMPDNEFKTFVQEFVPFQKRYDYIRLEKELEEKAAEEERLAEEIEYDQLQIQFIADLFESKEVTKDLILSGLDTADRRKIYEIIRYRVLGFNKADDEAAKKAMAEEILNGATSTSSN
ncbi:phage tail assembly chaperone G [Enterococcus sp. AZ189]|uniref:phage tail assembly chaperone G n=1 Tax=Enterococcus sp. AZ189 TaxID=2774871 RepID=UPI003F2606A0